MSEPVEATWGGGVGFGGCTMQRGEAPKVGLRVCARMGCGSSDA